jgi:hypothetical protein
MEHGDFAVFSINFSVEQGYVLPPILFTIYLVNDIVSRLPFDQN